MLCVLSFSISLLFYNIFLISIFFCFFAFLLLFVRCIALCKVKIPLKSFLLLADRLCTVKSVRKNNNKKIKEKNTMKCSKQKAATTKYKNKIYFYFSLSIFPLLQLCWKVYLISAAVLLLYTLLLWLLFLVLADSFWRGKRVKLQLRFLICFLFFFTLKNCTSL